MNKKTKLYALGDKFLNSLMADNIISLSKLEEMVKSHQKINQTNYDIYFGQGVNLVKVFSLLNFVKKTGLSRKYNFIIDKKFTKVDKLLTHKHKIENVMISEPCLIDIDTYESDLFIDDRCSEMSDHVTGQHIQGMVLIEAARQMTIAVSEKFIIEATRRDKLNFVTNSLEARFNHFIFPFEVKITCKINKIRGFKDNKNFDLTVNFVQNNIIAAEFRYIFSSFFYEVLEERQNEQAKKLIQYICE